MRTPAAGAPVDVETIASAGVSGTSTITTRSGWLYGYVLTNRSATAAALVTLYAGGTGTAAPIGIWVVPVFSSFTVHPSAPGWPLPGGLAVTVSTGTLDVSVAVAREVAT